jgi:hypothetical protein
LRRIGAHHAPAALANLLTPEIDAPVTDAYAALLRTADSSDAMLDEVVGRLLQAGAQS